MSTLGGFIETRRDQIIQRWADRVQLETGGRPSLQPDFAAHVLNALGRVSTTPQGPSDLTAAVVEPVLTKHGEAIGSSLTVDVLLRECGFLAEVVLELAREETSTPVPDEVLGVLRSLITLATVAIKRATEEQREGRRLARLVEAVFLSSPDSYVVLSPDFLMLAANEAYMRITNTKREQVIGQPLFEVFPDNPEDPTATGVTNLRASLERVLKHRRPDEMPIQRYDIRRPTSEGGGFEERYWKPLNTPVLNDQGEVEAIIHRVDDVTASYRLSQEVHRRKEFETQLVAIVSHDLRTPLQAIIMAASGLGTDADLDAQGRRRLALIQSSAWRATRLVADLLDFARLKLGKGLSLERRELDLRALASQVVEETCTAVRGRDVQLDCSENLRGQFDEGRLHQALSNLLGNAIQYSPADTPVRVSIVGSSSGIEMRVHNAGEPIPPELLSGLFEPFRRCARGGMGVGLGLFIVRTIIQAHGGTIEVNSSRERGTTFAVWLPRTPSDAAACEE